MSCYITVKMYVLAIVRFFLLQGCSSSVHAIYPSMDPGCVHGAALYVAIFRI